MAPIQDNKTSTSRNQLRGNERARNQQQGRGGADRNVEINSISGNEAEYAEISNEDDGYLQVFPYGYTSIMPAVVNENQPNATSEYEKIRI